MIYVNINTLSMVMVQWNCSQHNIWHFFVRTCDKARHMKLGSVTIQNSPNISGNNSGATIPTSGRAKSASTMTNTKTTTVNKSRIVRTSSASASPITKNAAELTLIPEKSTIGANQMSNAEDQDEIACPQSQCMLTTHSTSSLKCDVCSLSFHSQCAQLKKATYNQLVK